MKYKALIIVNPVAGKGKAKKHISLIVNTLEKSDFKAEIKYTSIENDACKIIKEYKDEYDVILIYGGDGTLNQAIQGIYEKNKEVCIGYIPIGTTNDFAKSLNFSFDKLHLSNNIKKYSSKKIDIALVDNRVINYVVAFGIFSKTS